MLRDENYRLFLVAKNGDDALEVMRFQGCLDPKRMRYAALIASMAATVVGVKTVHGVTAIS